jgi:hypothetical protein
MAPFVDQVFNVLDKRRGLFPLTRGGQPPPFMYNDLAKTLQVYGATEKKRNQKMKTNQRAGSSMVYLLFLFFKQMKAQMYGRQSARSEHVLQQHQEVSQEWNKR